MPGFPLEGGCLCGAVRYRMNGEYEGCAHCHCRMCQKATGAPVVTWFTVKEDDFDIVKGALKFRQSSEHAERGFCPDCGTQILFRYLKDRGRSADIAAATLDDPDAVEPSFQIHVGSRIGWMHGFDAALPVRKGALER